MTSEDHHSAATPTQRDLPPDRTRVAFVCQSFYPDKQAAGRLFSTMFAALGEIRSDDLDIEIVCGFPTQRATATRVPRRDSYAGFAVRRIGLPIDIKRGLASRALSYVAYLAELTLLLLTVPRATLVCAVTSPPFAPILVWIIATLRGMRYQIVLHDIYPDILVRLDQLRWSSPLARAWRWLSRRALGHAASVVALGRDMRKLVADKYRVAPDRIRVIPNWNVLPDAEPIEFAETPLARELALESSIVVQYAGNMGILHDVDIIVGAADLLREDDSLHFLLIGGGIRRAPAERLAQQLGLDNVTFLDYIVDDADVWNALCTAHVSLISLRAGLSGVAVPSKLYMSLASGRPIVAQVPDDSETAYVVREEDAGLVVAPGDVAGLAEAIRALTNDPALRERLGQNSRQSSIDHYDVRIGAARYLELFQA